MQPETLTKIGEASGTTLLQYGAIGALLLFFMVLFLVVFYRLFNHMLDGWTGEWKRIGNYMDEQTKALGNVKASIYESQKEIIYEIRSQRHENTQPHSLPPPIPSRTR